MLRDSLVMITRPESVADGTIKLFTSWGAEVCHAPVLKVHPVEYKLAYDIGELDTLIFVSRHSVRYSAKLIDGFKGKQDGLDILAVGSATAAFLKAKYGLTATTPKQGVGAAALLANFAPDYWRQRRVGVVRGVDAPVDLLDALASLNAEVRVMNVYKRQVNYAANSVLQEFVAAPHRTKIVTGFSSDSLSALREVAAKRFSVLALMPLLVVSPVIAQRAIDLSWSGPIETASSTDEAELRLAIYRLVQQRLS